MSQRCFQNSVKYKEPGGIPPQLLHDTMIITLIRIFIYIPLGLALHVSQPYRVVGKGGEVPLRCSFSSKLKPEEMQVSLYKGLHGRERICSAYVNLSEPYFSTDGTVNCRGSISSGRVDMMIAGLRGNDTDIYRCEIEILFPPPYLRTLGNGTIVYIQETPNCPTASTQSQIQSQIQTSEREDVKYDVGPLPLLYAILIITSCSLILQMIACKWRASTATAPMLSQKESYMKF
ncbi:T-cell-specific surface glycoprotein CD28-like [Carassius carassius]|uniref:T-cell-specific surface glycoprotein CD28-like n=1 Tax=Carassius carassius TaxID=217509 RepID=UPI0028688623|nr:T-cell-specific surface glycoprotein CD28-like [Carassius carassius]